MDKLVSTKEWCRSIFIIFYFRIPHIHASTILPVGSMYIPFRICIDLYSFEVEVIVLFFVYAKLPTLMLARGSCRGT